MTVEQMTQFPETSSPEQANLEAILKSPTYRIAREDSDFLNSNAMRGVRMLLKSPSLICIWKLPGSNRRLLFLVVPGSSIETLL